MSSVLGILVLIGYVVVAGWRGVEVDVSLVVALSALFLCIELVIGRLENKVFRMGVQEAIHRTASILLASVKGGHEDGETS